MAFSDLTVYGKISIICATIIGLINLTSIDCRDFYDQSTPISKEILIDLNDLNPSEPIFNPSSVFPAVKVDSLTSVEYTLKQNNDQQKRFTIDRLTGDLFVSSVERLAEPIETLIITRKYNHNSNLPKNEDKSKIDEIELTVKFGGLNEIRRVKRAAKNDNTEAPRLQFNLQLLRGDTEACQPGDSLDYSVTVQLPKGKENDLYIEIFTRKSLNPAHVPILSLFNVTLSHDKKIILPKSTSDPKLSTSKTNPNIYDRVTINLDGIENTGSTGNTLTIKFSVVMAYSDEAKTGSKHMLSIGAEYQANRFIWIGQDQIIYNKAKTDPVITGTLTGPEELILGSAAVYSLRTKMALRSDVITVEATVPNHKWAPENKISLGQIGIGAMGSNFAALPKDPTHYEIERFNSISKKSVYRSLLKLGVTTSLAASRGHLERNTEDEANTFEFKIPVYGLTYDVNNGSTANLTVRLVFGSKVRFTQTILIKLISKMSAASSTPVMSYSPVTGLTGDYLPKTVSPGDLTSIFLNVTLSQPETLTDLEVILKDAGPGSSIDSCGCQFLPGQSSPNIPYLNTSWFQPKQSQNDLIFTFEKVNVVNLYPSLTENIVSIEMAVQINANESLGGAMISIEVRPLGSSEGKFYETNVTIVPAKPEESAPLKMAFDKVVPWKEIHGEGGIAFEGELVLPPNANFSSVDLSIREIDSPTTALEICRVTIVTIGNSLPCTKALEPSLATHVANLPGNLSQTKTISFGDVCSKYAPNKAAIAATKDRTINAFIAIKGIEGIDTSSNRTLEVTWTGDPSGPWVQRLTIPIVLGAEIPTVASKLPKILVTKTTPGSTGVGQPTTGSIMMLLATQSTADYTIEVFPTQPDSNSSICSIWIKSVGHNMACFDGKPSTVLETRRMGLNSKATLHLGVISNLGPLREPLPTEEEEEADKIRLMTMVVLSQTATTDERFDVVIKSGKHSERSAFLVPINRFPKPLKSKADGFEIIDGVDEKLRVPIGGPASVRMRIMVKPNSMVQPVLTFTPSKWYNITDFEVSSIGQNYPCYSPFLTSKDLAKGSFALGVISNANVNKSSEANWIEVTAAIKVSPSATPGQLIKFEVNLEIPGAELSDKYESKLLAVKNIDPIVPTLVWINETVLEEQLSVRETRWITFNITTNPDWRSRFTVDATGEIIDGRPIVSVRDVRVSRLGRNLPGSLPPTVNVILNTTENRITGVFDYTANFGFSHRIDAALEGDDTIEIEVLVQMMSHSAALNGGEPRANRVTLRFMVESNQGLQVLAQGDRFVKTIPGTLSAALMDIESEINGPHRIFTRGETAPIRVAVKHADVSRYEPLEGNIRVYMPPYVALKSLVNSSRMVTVNQPSNKTYFDIKVPVVLFWETVNIDLNLIIDPDKLIGYGRGNIPTTLLITMFEGTKLISKFYHISLTYKSDDCFNQIELEDCQITGSSGINKTFGPAQSKLSSGSVWIASPASPFTNDFLEYDLLTRTRITGIQLVQPSTFKRLIRSFHLETSEDLSIWQPATPTIQVSSMSVPAKGVEGLVEVQVSGYNVETRYLRFIIDSLGPYSDPTDLMGVKVGLLGCRLPGSLGTCDNTKWTWYDEDEQHKTKHFLYAPDHATLYGCQFQNHPNNTECFRSKNGGDSWFKLPSLVHSLIGYHSATGRVIGRDSSRGKLIYTKDGTKWSPMSTKESTAIQDSPDSLIPVKVIGQSWDKFRFTSFDIKYSGHSKLQWISSCH
ncbi:uncharacterized protein LOC107368316 [Tetranychus urticae]|uniref:F5/8 type C domain-containing protein n=1 Tax=Tetranychus urticae TaxID=32264 RepID=T1KY01_TETUR|nr:uncharacterized protein LOC107368316 [Tetranychus urticae]